MLLLPQSFIIIGMAFTASINMLNSILSAIPGSMQAILYAFLLYAVVNILIVPIRGKWLSIGASDHVRAIKSESSGQRSKPARGFY